MKLNFDDLYQIESGASQKKIYRFKNNKEKTIVVDFTYNINDFVSFLDVHKFLSNINISIPKIFETDIIKKIIIMEDFGDLRYDKLIKTLDLKEILLDAVNCIVEIQNSKKVAFPSNFKKYNFSSFMTEISEFAEYYLPLSNSSANYADDFFYIWRTEFENINFNWDSFVHKDFELSNLMYLQDRSGHLKCGVIDFQNAFIGFLGWDLFSLLENPRIFFNKKYNNELIEYFYKNTKQKLSFKEFLLQYYFLNTARQTRIIGRWINLDKNYINNKYSKFLEITIKRLQNSLFNLKNQKLINLYDKILIK